MAPRRPKLSDQILEEASSWFIGFHEGQSDAGDREEFNAWLRRSPEHVRAYLEIAALWEDARALEQPGQKDIELLVARARAEYNVLPLDLNLRGEKASAAEPSHLAARPFVRKRSLALAASVLVAVGVGAGAWLYEQRDSYTTAIGEQRSITLKDGSSIELNSRSRLKVRFSDSERRIELLEGQALFRVAKNASRPFVVRSDDTSVRAVGTQFDVYRKRNGTIVTVVEGQVAVTSAAVPERDADAAQDRGSAKRTEAARVRETRATDADVPSLARERREVLLSAGEQVRVTPLAMDVPKPVKISKAMAWTEQRLVFEATPLRDVVEEFNRYNRQQLIISDPALNDFHVSGVFPSTDPNRMLEFLRQRFGVAIDRAGDEITISRREQVSF